MTRAEKGIGKHRDTHANNKQRWIVLLAHGSRDPRWRQPFEELVKMLGPIVGRGRASLAYLQLAEPSLEQVLKDYKQQGAEMVLVVPCFMSGGGHLQRDVAKTIEKAAAAAQITVHSSSALAEEPEVVDAMVNAIGRLARKL